MKSSTLLVVSRAPGRCGACRHANQGTVDFGEGLVFCQKGGDRRFRDSTCDQRIPAMPRAGGDLATYYLYEPYDGKNCTWGLLQDSRVLAEDADQQMREYMQWDRPFIPAGA